jgi:hypothetical protein
MNDASTPIGQPSAVNPPGKLAYATPTTAPLVAGRRSFFKYRDLGVTAASSGKIRAQVTIGAEGMTQPTGWHYHVCEGQFVYMLSGWVDLEFEDGQKLRIQSGESHTTFRAACGTTRRPHQETLRSWRFPFPRTWAPCPAIRLRAGPRARDVAPPTNPPVAYGSERWNP